MTTWTDDKVRNAVALGCLWEFGEALALLQAGQVLDLLAGRLQHGELGGDRRGVHGNPIRFRIDLDCIMGTLQPFVQEPVCAFTCGAAALRMTLCNRPHRRDSLCAEFNR